MPILAVNVVYFMANSAALGEARRVLRPGGRMVIYATHGSTMRRWPFAAATRIGCSIIRGLRRSSSMPGFARAIVSASRRRCRFGSSWSFGGGGETKTTGAALECSLVRRRCDRRRRQIGVLRTAEKHEQRKQRRYLMSRYFLASRPFAPPAYAGCGTSTGTDLGFPSDRRTLSPLDNLAMTRRRRPLAFVEIVAHARVGHLRRRSRDRRISEQSSGRARTAAPGPWRRCVSRSWHNGAPDLRWRRRQDRRRASAAARPDQSKACDASVFVARGAA